MTNIHVRSVSDETLTTLKVRATRSGKSLQAYLRDLLDEEAATLTADEAADRARAIAGQSTVTADDVVGSVEQMRAART